MAGLEDLSEGKRLAVRVSRIRREEGSPGGGGGYCLIRA